MANTLVPSHEADLVSGHVLKASVYGVLSDKTAAVYDQNLRPEIGGYSFLVQQSGQTPEQANTAIYSLLSTAMDMLRKNPPFPLTLKQKKMAHQLFSARGIKLDLKKMMDFWRELKPWQQDVLLNLSLRKLQAAKRLSPDYRISPAFNGRRSRDLNGLRVQFAGAPRPLGVRVWGAIAEKLFLSAHMNKKKLHDILDQHAPSPN